MTNVRKQVPTRHSQRGYALLAVLAGLAILAMGATMAMQDWETQGKRAREAELAYRGNQYVRAVRLYFKKYGHAPHTLADLTDYHTGQPRFIREAYKDPMAKADADGGGWRLIFVMPNGQLMGSVMHTSLSMGGIAPPVPNQNPLGGQQSPGGTSTTTGTGSATTTPGQTSSSTDPSQASGSDSSGNQQPPTFGSGQVFGGSLVGFASKIKAKSIRVYQCGGDTYFKWEFIYDPTSPTGVVQCGTAPATPPAAGSTGQPANGTQPQNPQTNQ